jgi:4a-hydroxytetrahydrobiopterin dehydratase
MIKLTHDQIKINISKLSNWKLENDTIIKQFQFKDFIEAISFVNAVGLEAEKMDHHPDILIYGWNKVKITLSTHSAGGITENDFSLAKKIDERLK